MSNDPKYSDHLMLRGTINYQNVLWLLTSKFYILLRVRFKQRYKSEKRNLCFFYVLIIF